MVFPFLNKKLDFSPEIETHKVIHAGLHELLAIIHAAKANTDLFDAAKLKEMMLTLKEPLVSIRTTSFVWIRDTSIKPSTSTLQFKHLDEEVLRIVPSELKVWEAHELKALNEELDKYAKSSGNPFLLVPYMRRLVIVPQLYQEHILTFAHACSATPPEYKDVWPPLPWVLRKVVIPYVLAVRYSGSVLTF